MAPYKGLKVVTYHRSWANFADRFGLDVIGYVEPKPGIPPTPSHTLDVIQEMKRQNVKLILVEPYFDLKTPQSIARATGAEVLVLPPSVGGVKDVTDYIGLFDYDVNTLVAAIKRDRSQIAVDLTTILEFLAAPFVASLILTGIHAYLGVHVVERGVIFVDLSLAQIAALGATIAVLMPISGGDPHAPVVYWISLAFTFIGAAVFSTIRSKRARIPQEAIIGICYAVASAAAILAMSKATSQAEHLNDMLVGQHPLGLLARRLEDGGALRRGRPLPFRLQEAVPRHLDGPEACRGLGPVDPALGLPLLRVFRFRGDVVRLDCRRAPGLLLPDRALGGGDAVFRRHRAAAGHRLDDGDGRVGAWRVSVGGAGSADRRDDRVHVRHRPGA